MDQRNSPLPIRRRGDKWEVVMMDGESIWAYTNCDTREEAEAVADARPLITMVMYTTRCEPARARRCLNALRRHGLGEQTLLGRRVRSLC